MDKKTALKVAEAYKKTVAERLPLKDLYLFGSYSKGNFTEQREGENSPLYQDVLKTGIRI